MAVCRSPKQYPEIADRFTDAMRSRFLSLLRYPFLGHRRDEDLAPGLRSPPVGNYIIFCQVKNEDIHILHVARRRRDLEMLFDPWSSHVLVKRAQSQ